MAPSAGVVQGVFGQRSQTLGLIWGDSVWTWWSLCVASNLEYFVILRFYENILSEHSLLLNIEKWIIVEPLLFIIVINMQLLF